MSPRRGVSHRAPPSMDQDDFPQRLASQDEVRQTSTTEVSHRGEGHLNVPRSVGSGQEPETKFSPECSMSSPAAPKLAENNRHRKHPASLPCTG